MKWNEQQLLSILPQRLRDVDFRETRELRLRLGQRPRLDERELDGAVTGEELRYIMNRLSSIPGVSEVSRNSK